MFKKKESLFTCARTFNKVTSFIDKKLKVVISIKLKQEQVGILMGSLQELIVLICWHLMAQIKDSNCTDF